MGSGRSGGGSARDRAGGCGRPGPPAGPRGRRSGTAPGPGRRPGPGPAVDEAQARIGQDPFGQFEGLAEGVPVVGGPAQPELADHLAVVAPRAQVVPGPAGVGCAQQPLVVPLHGPFHGVEQLGAALAVLAQLGVLVERHPGPVGQQADGIDEVQVLGGPDEGDGITRGLAAEAVVEALLGVDAERGALLGVERAQAGPAPPDPLEGGVLADEGHDVGGRPDLGHVLVRYGHATTVPRRCARPVQGLLGLGVAGAPPGRQNGLRRSQTGHRDPEGRAAHVVQAGVVEHGDRLGVPAVLAADAHLQDRLGGPAPLGTEADQLTHAVGRPRRRGCGAGGPIRGRPTSSDLRRRRG